jgi:hypothetical protein
MKSSPRIVLHSTRTLHTAGSSMDADEAKWQKYIRTHPSSPRGLRALGETGAESNQTIARVIRWAKHSVGWFEKSYEDELMRYGQIPSLKNAKSEPFATDVLQGMRNCMKIFGPLQGNRTCFQICD